MTDRRFLPGLDLAQSFYDEVVAARLAGAGIRHSAALIGPGSEVLGFDDLRSTDHFWGPRLLVFVADEDVDPARHAVRDLPAEHLGWPTVIGSDIRPFQQYVVVHTVGQWCRERLGFDPRAGITTEDWLAVSQQRLLELTAGRVFHDGLGDLTAIRDALAWYPHDVWLHLLADRWARIGEEEAFVGRTAEVGDDLGSRLVTARLAGELMHLCFLFERRYAPYSKWFGTAFHRLEAAATVGPALEAALAAATYPDREKALVQACEDVARRHNALGITRPEEPTVRQFHERPFLVLWAGRFADACRQAISQ